MEYASSLTFSGSFSAEAILSSRTSARAILLSWDVESLFLVWRMLSPYICFLPSELILSLLISRLSITVASEPAVAPILTGSPVRERLSHSSEEYALHSLPKSGAPSLTTVPQSSHTSSPLGLTTRWIEPQTGHFNSSSSLLYSTSPI